MSSSGKVPFFLVWGVDPCMFGKCLSGTWLKCVKARKDSSRLRQLVSLAHSLYLRFFLLVFLVFYLSGSLQEESIVELR